MTTFQIFRGTLNGWVLIRTGIESIELARQLRDTHRAEAPGIYRISQVVTTVVEED